MRTGILKSVIKLPCTLKILFCKSVSSGKMISDLSLHSVIFQKKSKRNFSCSSIIFIYLLHISRQNPVYAHILTNCNNPSLCAWWSGAFVNM